MPSPLGLVDFLPAEQSELTSEDMRKASLAVAAVDQKRLDVRNKVIEEFAKEHNISADAALQSSYRFT